MNCKLCCLEKKVVASHIIPEFVFRPLYDEKHRFYEIVADIEKNNVFRQKGVREPLLCEECELLFSKHEKYVAQVFGGRVPIQAVGDHGHIQVTGLDYKKFKLFGLSILWRAAVSNLQFFDRVSLGNHQEILRRRLLESNPGSPSDYPFFLTLILHEGELLSDLICAPAKVRITGHTTYRFVFSGMIWKFVVSSHNLSSILGPFAIGEDGKLKLFAKKLNDLPFIVESAIDLKAKGKLKF